MVRFACLFFLVLCHCGYGYPTRGDIEMGIPLQNATSFIAPSTNINKTTNADLTIDPAVLISHRYNSPANNMDPTTLSDEQYNISANKVANADLTMDPAILISHQYNSTTNKLDNTDLTIDTGIVISQQYNSTTINSSYQEELQGFAKKVVAKVKGGFNKVKTKVNVGVGKIKSKISDIKNNIGSGGGSGGVGTGINPYRRPYNPYNKNTSSGGGGSTDPTVLWVLLGLGVAGVLGTILYFMIRK